MVGGISVVGSSVVDSHSSPCLCLDSLSSKSTTNHVKNARKSLGEKYLFHHGSLKLRSSFIHSSRLYDAKTPSSRKQRKSRGLVVVNELGGQYEESFRDVHAQLFNLFTYKAVRTVMNQLYEMNPTDYRWFYDFVVINKPTEGKRFLRVLQKKVDHAEMYKALSDQNLELMRERLIETVIWPSDDAYWDNYG